MDVSAPIARSDDVIEAVLDALLDFEIAERAATAGLARRFSLNDSELTALALLARSGTQQVSRLAALLQLTAGSTSSLITRLTDRELITRRRSERDRRSVEIMLTESGRAVVTAMRARFYSAVEAALGDATHDCLVTTSGVLRATAADLLHVTRPGAQDPAS